MMRRVWIGAVLLSATAACTDVLFEPAGGVDSPGLYDELWRRFDEGYAPFEARGVDWSAAAERHRPPPDATDGELFAAMTALLAELDDGHVTLLAPGQPFFVAQQSFRDNTFAHDFDLDLIIRQMVDGPHVSGAARYGLLPGDVAYVHVSHWADPIPNLANLLSYLSGHGGVILDFRHNPGGDFTNGFPFAAGFADQRRLSFTTRTKTGPEHDALGQREEWFIEPAFDASFDGPVAVLVNGFTNSAAERTLLAFRTMPHVTIVGSPTAGNHGEKVGGELSNGWRYSIVPQILVAADGATYEGRGIPPDESVNNSAGEIEAGLDAQFEAAWSLIRASG